ncbi:MAG: cytidine deaminase [Christensenellales bacterium]
MHEIEIKNMIRMANDARDRAYAPYSNYKVGACLKGESGAFYLGCNVENAAYGPTNCAERTAVFKAISECERRFTAIAITSTGETLPVPCGICRQVLVEFCRPDMEVVCANKFGEYKVFTLGELLPNAFSQTDLNGGGVDGE